MANKYALGTEVTLEATFTDTVSGALTNPTTVTCQIETPSGLLVSGTVTNISTGLYRALYIPSEVGWYEYKFQGTGNCQVSSYDSFLVTALF